MEHHNELKGKALLFLFFLWFLWFNNFCVRVIFSPILPLMEDEFMITHAKASSIFIFQSIGYALSMLLSGFYSGKFGYKKAIALSLAISSAAFFLIPFVKTFFVFYIFSFAIGCSVGIYLPSVIPLITEYFAENNWGRAISIHDTAAPFSIFCTPFIALFFLQFFQWRGIFVVFAIVFLVSLIIFCFTCDELKIKHSGKAIFGDLIKNRSLWIMAVLWIFIAGANMGVYFIAPLYLTKELSLDIKHANTILGISRLGGIGVAILCGLFVDRFNLKKIIFIMMFLTGILTVLTGVSPVRFIGVTLFFQALFVTGFFPLGLVSIAKMFDREARSLAMGIILTLSVLVGGGIIPYLLGLSGDLISFRFGISLLGICVILSSSLVFYLKELK
jgi:NNP family nitrate/nitrite transporter-like MFS transporter